MADKISLQSLIDMGQEIRNGISYVPSKSTIRTFNVYKLADNKTYADWKGLVYLYLQINNVGINEQEIKELFEKLERYYYSPQVLEEILGRLKAIAAFSVTNNMITSCVDCNSRKVFIVHGHNEEYIEKVARLVEKLECEPIILKEQPNSGKTIIEKFEVLANAAFAVVLYTACDKGAINNVDSEWKPRARQNVIFEHGYLYARLGRNRVCALVQDGVEIPSDLSGVLYVSIDKNDSWKFQLAKEMKNAGISIDMNKI